MNKSCIFHYNPPASVISISLIKIIANMGYSKENIPSGLKEILDSLYLKFIEDTMPECGFIIQTPNSTKQFGNGIVFNDTVFQTGSKIASRLKNIEGIIIFVLTIGNRINDWIKELVEEDDICSAYLVDLIASEYVEKLSDWIEEKIKVELGNSIGISHRYGPGYCDWNLTEQGKLFNFFPNNFCGITLSEKSIMKPQKSLSGIIGFGKNVIPSELPCDICTDFKCHKNIKNKK